MITMRFGPAEYGLIPHKFGYAILKQRRDARGRYLRPDKDVILDRTKIDEEGINPARLRLMEQLGLL